jgi:cathepsin L
MKRYRILFIVTLILFFVGIPILLSAAEQRITPPVVAFDYKARELKAPPHIVSKLTQLRSQIATQKLSFKVGYTAAMDFDLAKIAVLKVPPNLAQLASAQNKIAEERLKELPPLPPACSTSLSSFDWRIKGVVTRVKDQGPCGSCWDFATIGAFEGSWAMLNKRTIDASEQDVLDCSGRGDCVYGGWVAFQYLIDKGVATEASYPYHHSNGTCRTTVARSYKADTWGYVGTDHNIPSVSALKQALCLYGPLYVTVRATPAFQAYVGGVFDEHASGSTNHAVTLIGWDDSLKAWIIKNSWGTGWGDGCGFGLERGYMLISYTSNSIGRGAAWVRAHTKIALKSWLNWKYVSAENEGKPFIASSTTIGPRETFEMVSMGTGKTALKSMANGKFVCAENGGREALIANRTAAARDETFEMVSMGTGKIALKSMANGKFVCAENAGAAPLIANRTTAVPMGWETFEMVSMGTGKTALKSMANGKFVSVDNGIENLKPLIANRTTAARNEIFLMAPVPH